MLANAITAVKTALLDLVDYDDAAIFAAATEIMTGWPHPNLVTETTPVVKEPLVSAYFYGRNVNSRGYGDHIRRYDDDTVAPPIRRDEDSLADVEVNCDVYVLAKENDELVGTAAWDGYVEQIMRIVATHPEIIGPRDTIIGWELDNFDVPGEFVFPKNRNIFLAVIKTVLTGKLTAEPIDAGRVLGIVPYDDEFTPVAP